MAAVPRGPVRLDLFPISSLCTRCWRSFATTSAAHSGHNRWSKIRHGKGAADAKKTALRSTFAKSLTLYSKLYGADVNNNPQLATAVAAAKKAGVPKATIETAIARGQGRSTEGATLESLTFEVMMPPSVALILDIETDNRQRVLQDLNCLVRRCKGTPTPTKFFFSRVGRVVFGASEGAGMDEIMDDAIEAGAEDLEAGEDGTVVVWTQPNQTNQVAQAIRGKFNLEVLSADIIWSPNRDAKSKVGSSGEVQRLVELLARLREHQDVQAIYSNVAQGDMDGQARDQLGGHLDA